MKGLHALAVNRMERSGLGGELVWAVRRRNQLRQTRPDQDRNRYGLGCRFNGIYHTLALKSDGTLWAWGCNEYGQLGDGTTVEKHVPVQIATDSDWIVVDQGDGGSFALKSNGTLWAWGSNQGDCMGYWRRDLIDHHVPVQIGADNNWSSNLGFGRGRICPCDKIRRTLWAWGSNWDGQLMNGTYNDQPVPIQVTTDNTWSVVAAGYGHSVA